MEKEERRRGEEGILPTYKEREATELFCLACAKEGGCLFLGKKTTELVRTAEIGKQCFFAHITKEKINSHKSSSSKNFQEKQFLPAYLKITTGKNTGEKNQGEMLYARLFCQTPFLIKIRNNSQRPSLDLPILVLLPPLIFSMTCSSFFSPPPLSNPPFLLLLSFPPQLLGRRYTDSISYFSRPGVKRGKREK